MTHQHILPTMSLNCCKKGSNYSPSPNFANWLSRQDLTNIFIQKENILFHYDVPKYRL